MNNWSWVLPDEPVPTIEDEPITVKRETKLGMEVYGVYVGNKKVNQFLSEPSARHRVDCLRRERERSGKPKG